MLRVFAQKLCAKTFKDMLDPKKKHSQALPKILSSQMHKFGSKYCNDFKTCHLNKPYPHHKQIEEEILILKDKVLTTEYHSLQKDQYHPLQKETRINWS